MLIAIDKKTIGKVPNNYEYIYIFDDDELSYLKSLNMRCVNYEYIKDLFVDINLTDYDIDCIKKANIKEENWDILPETKENKFAIIVPNYNNDRCNYNNKTFLRNCIDSILSQTYNNFELIIVDDMSNDTSIETIESYKDHRIHLIKNIRKRYNGGSRNVGIEYALNNFDFDYFCFLDSDDWWKDNNVLEYINRKATGQDMLIIGAEMLFKEGVKYRTFNEYKTYEDFFISEGKSTLWCTAWCRIIKKDKIVYFCENTLMEDRVWSYRQADNIDFNKVVNLKKICYVWNRMNTSNSVSIVRNYYWDASAWCHIGHQLQLIEELKHKEMVPIIKKRIEKCKKLVKDNVFQQY